MNSTLGSVVPLAMFLYSRYRGIVVILGSYTKKCCHYVVVDARPSVFNQVSRETMVVMNMMKLMVRTVVD